MTSVCEIEFGEMEADVSDYRNLHLISLCLSELYNSAYICLVVLLLAYSHIELLINALHLIHIFGI